MAIVHQQDVPAFQAAGQLVEHARRLATQRIETASRPARELQAQACQNGIEKRVSQAGRGSKEFGVLTRHAANLVLCALDLIGDRARAED